MERDHRVHDHDHGHGHGHANTHGAVGHSHVPASQGKLFWALVLTCSFMAIETVGGLISGSLALLADAAHMLTDAAALAMGYAAVRAATRPATHAMSYGHHRWQVLAAFINGLLLFVLAIWIFAEAAQRLRMPGPVQGNIVTVIAFGGLLVNLGALWVLSRGESNLNVRAAVAHMIGDVVGSVAALAAGAVIVLTGWMPIDPILSVLVALIMCVSGWRITRTAAHILLEGTPPGLESAHVVTTLLAEVPNLSEVHHVHLWSLTDELPMMTLHAVISEGADSQQVLARIQHVTHEHFRIGHLTVQIERTPCADCDCEPAHDH